jgi:hypothetical protein
MQGAQSSGLSDELRKSHQVRHRAYDLGFFDPVASPHQRQHVLAHRRQKLIAAGEAGVVAAIDRRDCRAI